MTFMAFVFLILAMTTADSPIAYLFLACIPVSLRGGFLWTKQLTKFKPF